MRTRNCLPFPKAGKRQKSLLSGVIIFSRHSKEPNAPAGVCALARQNLHWRLPSEYEGFSGVYTEERLWGRRSG